MSHTHRVTAHPRPKAVTDFPHKKRRVIIKEKDIEAVSKIDRRLRSRIFFSRYLVNKGSCRKRQKPQEPTPQAPIRNRQTRKVANAKGLNRNTNLN